MVLFSNLKEEHTELQMLFFEQSRQLANKTRKLTVLEKASRQREALFKASGAAGALAFGTGNDSHSLSIYPIYQYTLSIIHPLHTPSLNRHDYQPRTQLIRPLHNKHSTSQ